MNNDAEKTMVLTPDEVRKLIVERNLDVERILSDLNSLLARWDGTHACAFDFASLNAPSGERGREVMRQVLQRLRDAGWTVRAVGGVWEVTA